MRQLKAFFFYSEEQYKLMILLFVFGFPIYKVCVYVGCISASWSNNPQMTWYIYRDTDKTK